MSVLDTIAVVIEKPEHIALRRLDLNPCAATDLVVEIAYSGISTGTERLLYSGRMPPFPGLSYPLVPGYESVGRVVSAGDLAQSRIGERVFVPGSSGFKDARGLFGGAARRVVVAESRVVALQDEIAEEQAVLLALAATAQHAIAGFAPPQLIVGHGVLGRLLARVTIAAGFAPPTVWETNPARHAGAEGYSVIHPDQDPRRDYGVIADVSGDSGLLDSLIARLAKGGEIVLAGFYEKPLSFAFPPSFMKEARLRVAAEWKPQDLAEVLKAIAEHRLMLDGLITHRMDATRADQAYRTAFGDASCLKMVLDWRQSS
jgi:3-hydroxyethyl bacteriochlorophyllide a dehydrogenase